MAPSATNGTTKSGGDVTLPPLYEHCVDDYRPMKVICIGAGISGILTAIRFPQRIPNLELTIYEKNADVGGTWFENRYPGVRCDIPSASYQFTFDHNDGQWSEYYSSGAEIQGYLKRCARKYGAYKYIKFQHMLKAATWHATTGKWELELENLTNGTTFTDTCDIYVSATGILNKWKWPEIEGLDTYQGKLVHSANWDAGLDLNDKDVALIGAGSSGIQILPTIQPHVKRVDHYMSGKTWISPIGFGSEELHNRGAIGNFKHSKEELESFKDPAKYLAFRHKIERTVNEASLITIFGTPSQQNFQLINRDAMSKKLAKKPEIMEALEPSFPPGCRRLTPGPGYLEALVEDNVEFINTKIKRIVPEGIETVDGKIRKVEVIICATGFDTTLRQPIPIKGENGITLDEVWDPTPECYFGILPNKMPNHLRYLGPNGGPGTGSLIHLVECAAEYMIKVIRKLQREYIKSIVVSPRANAVFSKHVDKYFTKTIYTQPCKSWMKRGKEHGRVVTLWPGSCIHGVVAFENPRWEDFNYEYLPETEENQLSWLGNGITLAQQEDRVTTSYLDTVDVPPVINPQDIGDLDNGYSAIKVTGML